MGLLRGFWVINFVFLSLISTYSYALPDKSPDFEIQTIKVAGKSLKVAVADTAQKRRYGLMHRTSWGEWEGMLFIFSGNAKRSFWMKNTKLALSIGFFKDDGSLLEVYDLRPQKSVFQKAVDRANSKKPAKYALEVPQGWFKKNKINAGDEKSRLILSE